MKKEQKYYKWSNKGPQKDVQNLLCLHLFQHQIRKEEYPKNKKVVSQKQFQLKIFRKYIDRSWAAAKSRKLMILVIAQIHRNKLDILKLFTKYSAKFE